MHLFRPYESEDYEIIQEWYRAHDRVCPPIWMLAPSGVFAMVDGEDIAASWLYFVQCVPVCFIEHTVTKPGMSLANSKAALLAIAEYFKSFAASQGAALLITHTIEPIARHMKTGGWIKSDRPVFQMVVPLVAIAPKESLLAEREMKEAFSHAIN